MRSPTSFLVATLVISVASLAPLRARAEAAAPPAAADRKTATEVCQLILTPDTYATMIDQMSVQMAAALQQQTGHGTVADARDKIKKAVTEAVPYDEVIGWNADLYASRFSTDELKQLAAFYRTPVGKKAARLQPEVSAEVGKKMGPILMERLPGALKKQGINPG